MMYKRTKIRKTYPLWPARSIIMVFFIIFAIGVPALQAQDLPEPTGFVNDFAGVLDSRDINTMEAIITAVEQKTGAEIAVVTVETVEPYGSLEQYSVELAHTWGIGKEGEDNGILLILAMKEREVRLEVGYGLEGAIPDGLAGEILDTSVLPAFRQGNYGEGFTKGVKAVAGIIAEEYNVELGDFKLTEHKQYSGGGGGPDLGYLFFLLIFLFVGGGRFLWPLIFLGGVHRRGFYGGGFGSGGSAGSFGGFGGGGFGGGGASRGF